MTELKKPDVQTAQVRDVMRKEVVLLSPDDAISSVVQTFEEYHITGAPVVDGAGKAVGVLTVADLTRDDRMPSGRLSVERYEYDFSTTSDDEYEGSGEAYGAKQGYSAELVGDYKVRDWMTERVVSVDQEALLPDACRMMVREGIHRVLVTEENAVIGILSAFDVVRYLGGES